MKGSEARLRLDPRRLPADIPLEFGRGAVQLVYDSQLGALVIRSTGEGGPAALIVPDLGGMDGEVVVTNLAQTLSNKSLSDPEITGGVTTDGMARYGLKREFIRPGGAHTRWLPLNAGWTEAITGSGTTIQDAAGATVNTGLSGSSTAMLSANGFGMSRGIGQASVNWGKRHHLTWVISSIATGTANGRTYLHWMANVAAVAPLSARGFGFEVRENALWGVHHNGSTFMETDLASSLGAGITTHLEVRFRETSGAIEWIVNGSVAGSSTVGLPSGNGTPGDRMIIAVDNGGDAARQRIVVLALGITAEQV